MAVFNDYSRPKFNIARYLIYKFYILANKSQHSRFYLFTSKGVAFNYPLTIRSLWVYRFVQSFWDGRSFANWIIYTYLIIFFFIFYFSKNIKIFRKIIMNITFYHIHNFKKIIFTNCYFCISSSKFKYIVIIQNFVFKI